MCLCLTALLRPDETSRCTLEKREHGEMMVGSLLISAAVSAELRSDGFLSAGETMRNFSLVRKLYLASYQLQSQHSNHRDEREGRNLLTPRISCQ